MNDRDMKVIFDEMEKNHGFDIVEHPEPGEFLSDLTVNFLYPHRIALIGEAIGR
jgi:hypothetical protein